MRRSPAVVQRRADRAARLGARGRRAGLQHHRRAPGPAAVQAGRAAWCASRPCAASDTGSSGHDARPRLAAAGIRARGADRPGREPAHRHRLRRMRHGPGPGRRRPAGRGGRRPAAGTPVGRARDRRSPRSPPGPTTTTTSTTPPLYLWRVAPDRRGRAAERRRPAAAGRQRRGRPVRAHGPAGAGHVPAGHRALRRRRCWSRARAWPSRTTSRPCSASARRSLRRCCCWRCSSGRWSSACGRSRRSSSRGGVSSSSPPTRRTSCAPRSA